MSFLAPRSRPELHADARIAGVVYLAVIGAGIFSLAYVPGQLSIVGTGSSYLDAIVRREVLFRFGIAAEIICQTAFLILPFALCRVLWSVNIKAAILMVTFAAAGVPLGFANLAHHFEVLRAIVDFKSSALTAEQADAAIAAARASYREGMSLLFVFWGAWLLPLGYLVIRSGFLPVTLGALLIVRGVDYALDCFGLLLIEDYASSSLNRALSVGRFAEILFCAWILVFGARRWVIKLGRQTTA